MTREERHLRTALDNQELIAKEMNHRLKNLFAMTDGMRHRQYARIACFSPRTPGAGAATALVELDEIRVGSRRGSVFRLRLDQSADR
jgi:hypothetical protein